MAVVTHGLSLLRNSNHALDAAYNTTDHAADDAANHGSDWPGRALTEGDPLLSSTHNALGLGRERCRNSGNNDDGHRELRLHEQTPLLMFAVSTDDAENLVPAIWRHHEANVAAISKIAAAPSGMLPKSYAAFSDPEVMLFSRTNFCIMRLTQTNFDGERLTFEQQNGLTQWIETACITSTS